MPAEAHKRASGTAVAMSLPPKADICSASAAVHFGSLADIWSAQADVRFTPESDSKSRHSHAGMSALPLKADMCSALANVGYGPEADIPQVPLPF